MSRSTTEKKNEPPDGTRVLDGEEHSKMSAEDVATSSSDKQLQKPPGAIKQSTPTAQKDGVKQKISSSPPTKSPSVLTRPACSSQPLFPVRQGIAWQNGTRLEAMDFLEKWYPAKITDIDEEDCMVLIHFEGWNQRYDEWVHMSSEKIRPLTRHSVRKEKKRGHVKSEHRAGDLVYAKWTDCRIYPARITTINTDGSYEVLFYDGFNKTVQPINIRAMPAKTQAEMLKHSDILSSKGFKSMKAAMKSGPGTPSRRRSSDVLKDADVAGKAGGKEEGATKIKKPVHKRKRIRPKHNEKDHVIRKSNQTKGCVGLKFGKKRKLLVGGAFSFQAKRPRQESEPKPSRVKRKIRSKEKDSDCGSSPEKKMKTKETTKTKETAKTKEATKTCQEAEAAQAGSSSENLITPADSQPQTLSSESQSSTPQTKSNRVKKSVRSHSAGEKAAVTSPQQEAAADKATLTADTKNDLIPEKVSAPKEFKVEDDHNHFKCPFEGCNKSFRKESLVEYHIKYYHAEDRQLIPPPMPRSRKKTTSICSNDSDISVTSLQTSKPGKKKRGVSAPSLLQAVPGYTSPAPPSGKSLSTAVEETTSDITDGLGECAISTGLTDQQEQKDHLLTEDSVDPLDETEEESENKDEIVSCICQYSEENGLMIQCDVCLCWQHAICCNITEETLPKKYVCYVCQSPHGIRESARYIYNQDWLQLGQMAEFNFLKQEQQQDSDRNASLRLSAHELMCDIHNIKQVLKSLSCNIHILENQEEFPSQLKVWTRNWDMDSEESDCVKKTQSDSHAECDQVTSVVSESIQDMDIEEHINVVDVSTDMITEIAITQTSDADSSREDTQNPAPDTEQLPTSADSTNKSHSKDSELHSSSVNTGHAENEQLSLESNQDNQKSEEANTSDEAAEQSGQTEELAVPKKDTESATINSDSTPGTHQTTDQSQLDYTGSDSRQSVTEHPRLDYIGSDSTTDTASESESHNSPPIKTEHTKSRQIASGQSESSTSNPPGQHDYTLSLTPSSVKLTGNSIWKQVTKTDGSAVLPDEEKDLEEEDLTHCEQNLLSHVLAVQDDIDQRMDLIENQITELEESEGRCMQDFLSDVPHVTKTLQTLLRDLDRVKRMSMFQIM